MIRTCCVGLKLTINIQQQQQRHLGLVAKFHGLPLSTSELFFFGPAAATHCVPTMKVSCGAIRHDISNEIRYESHEWSHED